MAEQPPLELETRNAELETAKLKTRNLYLDRLREHLHDPDFRAIEGFPIGEDDAILALSDPPYYTACPNPFLTEIIARWQAERAQLRADLGLPDDGDDNGNGKQPVYHREPFASDVSEGKNNPIYNAHSYHTKVPHKAIMRYILHYTDPGDVVFDGFCGTGMTGVAAQLCGDRKAVEGLGYRVDDDGAISSPLSHRMGEGGRGGEGFSRLGARKAALVDLSPAATFIAYNYNTPVDVAAFEREANRILREVEEECGWMYETLHTDGKTKGRVNYTVWSDVFVCPECGGEIVYWNEAFDTEKEALRSDFACPYCQAMVDKRRLDRAWEAVFDDSLNIVVRYPKQVPVLIKYLVGKRRYQKQPDEFDLAMIRQSRETSIPYWYPVARMMFRDGVWGDEWRKGRHEWITHTHHFYLRRNLWVLAALWARCEMSNQPLKLVFQSMSVTLGSRLTRYNLGNRGNGPISGTLYIGSLIAEGNVLKLFAGKVKDFAHAFKKLLATHGLVTCQSTSSLPQIPSESVDYIFVDPPFGDNLMYAELNFLWEAWPKVFTNIQPEAVVSKTQQKRLYEYQRIMESCFRESYRVLKPGRWMTVEFHNSKNTVWNAIQEAILRAGFVIADVRTLDKQQGSFKQVTATGAVKQDLVISAYEPRSSFERRFQAQAGTAEGAWDFVRQHLAQLPVVVHSPSPVPTGEGRGGGRALEVVAERQAYLLFDRMVAFHIQRGATVPLSAAGLYAGLRERFVERDGMYFTPDQVPEYDRARLEAAEVAQLTLFVSDEKSTIQWLRQQLDLATGGQPQTYQELQPQFLRQLHQARHEVLPELSEMLEQNFLQDESGRWYVADPGKADDLEKLRRRALLREFNEYVEGRGRLRKFRTEAIRAGFADAWRRRDYGTIVKVAERLPERVLQEDPDLLMYYDNATLRVK